MSGLQELNEMPKAGIELNPQAQGLRRGVLSPVEVLAQSISTIAPSTSPTLTVPLVFALAGEGTALAYGCATAVMFLVALSVALFARESASPGSLYAYVHKALPPVFGAVTAWALFFAYVMIAASCVGGFVNYAQVLLGAHLPAPVWALLVCVLAVVLAARDVKLSARVMLWTEAISVLLILVVVVLTLWHYGARLDVAQLDLHAMSAEKVRLGVVLAMFSFVGFESATTLGAEARNPLRTIPRAVILSAVLAGAFFLLCVYGEALGFRLAGQNLGESTAPFRLLATRAGIGSVGVVIDLCVLVAMFSAVLGCVMASSRVLMLMAQSGLVDARLGRTHARHQSPVAASLLAGVLVCVPAVLLLLQGVRGADLYGYMGTLAVFGFLTVYFLSAIALAVYLRRHGRLRLAQSALVLVVMLAMLAALAGTLYPVPGGAYRFLPYVYLAYLVVGALWFALRKPASPCSVSE
ncbi:MAG: APC family permease [Acidobacteriaceae bacterium]|nr:APC family permease [Acidobacteriaceae bacterium]